MLDYVKIKYTGGVGNHIVHSPTRTVLHYGLHTRGDVFEVHINDQRERPALFVLVPEPSVVSVTVDNKPEVEAVVESTAEAVELKEEAVASPVTPEAVEKKSKRRR
jgi:hypothetical protein